jgi:predicted RNA-binding Zn-ribbon protein involved in translation (DUF1610 family)
MPRERKTMAKGFYCGACGRSVATQENGVFRCTNEECGAMWWDHFTRPTAGQPRKGYRCPTCTNHTMHPLGMVAGAEVYGCSTCGSTVILRSPGIKIERVPT